MAKTAVAPQNCLLCCQIDGFLGTSPDIVCTDLQDTTLLHLMPVLIVQILTEIQSLSFSIKPLNFIYVCPDAAWSATALSAAAYSYSQPLV